ncbi:NAD(P)/FAD-dependent oxidoreductase [Ramlibacter sp.]|uniref:NAD(P)/FAD-dependent oxidoreductase n=1 Tax=Ramlibacter sp. TaxID=1917967 RepID=UPI003D0BDDD6
MIETDALIVGAGPVGLFQVFELGLLEIRCHVVDSLPHVGGQCVELYGDKPIYDIPSVQVCTGRELVDNLMRQAQPFAPVFHLGQVVTRVEVRDDGRFVVETSRGIRFLARTVFIAAGVGAFLPRTVKVDGIDAFEGSQLFHRVEEAGDAVGRHVVILGDEDAAVDASVALANESQAASVTLLHRRDVFRAAAPTVDAMRALVAAKKLQLVIGQVTGFRRQDSKLTALEVAASDATKRDIPADTVLALLGLSPKLGPVADWGLDIERKQLKVDTESYATSVRGIFAVGDVNTYPGKKKLILCGFHEATLAAFGAAALIFPDRKTPLQYTTTSPRLHELLGVSPTIE